MSSKDLSSFSCNKCGKVDTRKDNHKRHTLRCKGSSDGHVCKNCNKALSKLSNLKRYETIHERTDYECNKRKSKFTRRDHFASHKIICDTNETY